MLGDARRFFFRTEGLELHRRDQFAQRAHQCGPTSIRIRISAEGAQHAGRLVDSSEGKQYGRQIYFFIR